MASCSTSGSGPISVSKRLSLKVLCNSQHIWQWRTATILTRWLVKWRNKGAATSNPTLPHKLQKSREDDLHIDNNLKANMDWTKAVNCVQRTIAQYSQLLLKCMATGNAMTKGHMSGVSTHLMTNITECYAKVLAQSTSITELTQEG